MSDRTINDAMDDLYDDIDTVYENKLINKKNNIAGDYTGDTASYPTVQAVKNEMDKKVDIAQANANHFVITDNAKNIALQNKIGNLDVTGAIGSTSGLLVVTDNSGVLNTSGTIITIGEKATPNTGAFKTYQLLLNGAAVTGSVDIDVPNLADMFLRSASLETVGATPTADETAAHLVSGDKYLKLVVNTSASETGATIFRIKLTEFIDIYRADEITLTKSNSNVFSIKDGGVTQAKLDATLYNSLVTETKLVNAIDYLREQINPTNP